MGNSMMKVIFSVLACAVLATSSSATIAEAAPLLPNAEQQAVQPAERASWVDVKGNAIAVVSYSDGTFSVAVNDETPLFGEKASSLLASSGIFFKVDPQGKIIDPKIRDGVKVVEAPHAVPSGASEVVQTQASVGASVAKAPSADPVLPADLVMRSRTQTDWATTSVTYKPSFENNLNEKPISK